VDDAIEWNLKRQTKPNIFFQVMPQLLHFLQVDNRTTVVGDASTDNITGEGEGQLPPVPQGEKNEDEEGSSAVPPVITSGTFQNNSNKVRW
jgi:hypothetical protein